MKLHHMSEDKYQGRGTGGYTTGQTPAPGGESGSKRFGMLEVNALLSHGATESIRDASLVRGQESRDYWQQFMSGNRPPTPKIPHVYKKFVNRLRASGINVVRDGTRMNLMAMTDKDIDFLAGERELKGTPGPRGERRLSTVDWKQGLRPLTGGLFDPAATGGHNGNQWSFIKLHEPMPNPVMEEPIRALMGLTTSKFEDVMAGREKYAGRTGPRAIAHAMESLNVDKELERARAEIKTGKRSRRDKAVKRLGYLKQLKKTDMKPSDWILSKAPVLPPTFRPVATMGKKKLPLIDDANHLYKELFDANQLLGLASEQLGDDVGEERLAAYKAFKGVTGLGDPINPKNKEQEVKGILRHVFGKQPKLGTVQRQLLGSNVDFVGRAVIAPDPDLDMDHVGIPEERAWDIYKPFIIRRLALDKSLRGRQAMRAVEDRSPQAREALIKEMEARPVLINRAPTLHKYGVMAAWPKLVKGNVMKVSPLIVGGFNADFDGDAMAFHVPTTDEAAKEAQEKLLPSRNLFSASSFGVHYTPSMEYQGGLYEASSRIEKKQPPRVFATQADAIRAYERGDINVGRRIEIVDS